MSIGRLLSGRSAPKLCPRFEERLGIGGQSLASPLKCRPAVTRGIIRNDAGRKRGRIVPPANPSAPQVGAPNHECRRDWEGGVSGQANVLFLF